MKSTKQNIRNIFDIILPMLAIGIYFGYSTSIICIILLIVRVLFLGNDEKAIFFLLFGTAYMGLLFTILEVPFPGSILSLLIGFFIIHKKIFKLIIKYKKSYRYLFLLILIFFLSYLYGPKTEYSNVKMISIIYVGFLSLIAFLVYSTSTSISNRDLAQILMLVGISYIVIGIDFLSYSKPVNLFDFSYFRISSVSLKKEELLSISYHMPAITVLYGFSFWLSSVVLKKKEIIYLILYGITTLYVILISGTRQALFGFFIVIMVRLLFLSYKNRIFNYFLTIIIITLFSQSIFNTSSESLNSISQSDSIETAMNRDYLRTFEMISNYPVFGVGLGGFYNESISKHKYPHNIILEILCEGGLIMFFLVLFLIRHYLRKKNKVIKYKTSNNSFLFLIFIAYAIRAMISEDLGANVSLFSILLSFVILNNKKLLKK